MADPPPGVRAAGPALRDWEAYALVFGSSLCTLVLEIVAGRLLAPTIGVSLFTWTSVIGVVLAGVAAGNYAGGLAARRAGPAALPGVLLAAGAATWAGAAAVRVVDLNAILASADPVWRNVVLVAAFFFLPTALLGTVTPLVAQLTLRQRADAGAVVGRLGAVAAAGSIAGTFLTGFVLIPLFGTRAILAGVAAALVALAGLAARGRVRPPGAWSWVAIAAGAGAVGAVSGLAASRDANACLRETAYFCSRVEARSFAGVRYGVLLHDRIVQGYTAPDEPLLLVGGWTQAVADVAGYVAARRGGVSGGGPGTPLRALFIGGGSFTVPRYLEAAHPGSTLDVLEIDPGVTATARAHLGLRVADRRPGESASGTGVAVEHGDARLAVRGLADSSYDLVYGDAFSDLAVPWHLTTVEFAREVRRVLRDDGAYVINVVDAWPDGRFLASFFRTLREAFPHAALLRVGLWDTGAPPPGELDNWVLVATARPLDAARLESIERPGPWGVERARARVVAAGEVERWLAGQRPPVLVLTDNHAPVDAMLAGRLVARRPA